MGDHYLANQSILSPSGPLTFLSFLDELVHSWKFHQHPNHPLSRPHLSREFQSPKPTAGWTCPPRAPWHLRLSVSETELTVFPYPSLTPQTHQLKAGNPSQMCQIPRWGERPSLTATIITCWDHCISLFAGITNDILGPTAAHYPPRGQRDLSRAYTWSCHYSESFHSSPLPSR